MWRLVESVISKDPEAWSQSAFLWLPRRLRLESKMADSVQVEEPQRRAVGGIITTGRIHKGIGLDNL